MAWPNGSADQLGCRATPQLGSGVQRLKTRPQFQAALAGGTVSRTPHFALHRLQLPEIRLETQLEASDMPGESNAALFHPRDVWLGAMVPKRWAKRAVTRNAIKRQIYAVSAQFEVRMPCAAHVVRLRSGFDRQQFISATSPLLKLAVRQELEQLFERAANKS
jgi:ribonuclease P protein component